MKLTCFILTLITPATLQAGEVGRGTGKHSLGSSNNLSIVGDATEGTSDCSDVVCLDEFR